MYFTPLFHGSKTIAMVTDVRIHPFWPQRRFRWILGTNNDSKISDLLVDQINSML